MLAKENDRNTWGFTLRAESDSDLNVRKLKFRISRNKCSCHFCLEIVKKDLKLLFWRFKRLVDRKGMTDRKITLSFWNTCYKVRCDKGADQIFLSKNCIKQIISDLSLLKSQQNVSKWLKEPLTDALRNQNLNQILICSLSRERAQWTLQSFC